MVEDRYVALGHRLSDEDWAAVVRRANEVRQELLDSAAGGASGLGGIIVDMTARCLASKKYFGVSGIPTQLLVLHSAECPLRAGFAISLTEWFSATVHPAPPTASWQRFVDPVHRVRAVPDELGAWHASEANVLSIGWEQAGYARFTREEWLTPDGQQQLELLAMDMAEVALRDGIPARWLTTAEVTAATSGNRSIKGFCCHRQIDPETRTDPGNGYPYDLLMSRINYYMANPTQEDELSAADVEAIAAAINHAFGRIERELPGAVAKAVKDAFTVEHRDPKTAEPDGQTTSLGTVVAFRDFQDEATRRVVAETGKAVLEAIQAQAGGGAEAAYNEFLEKLAKLQITITPPAT